MAPFVVPHDPDWARAFAVEAATLKDAIGANCLALHHIGSTAIAGILAKPVIDILGAVRSPDDLDAASGRIELLGYAAMGAYGIEGRRYFRKEDSEGRRTHHLHVYETSSPHIDRHLAFRDYLRSHPHKAAEYSALKAEIVNSGALYQNTKDRFVQQIQVEALAWWCTTG